jgi:predicted Ser/Thr protein kinase
MQTDFNREELNLWEMIDETYAIDRSTLLGKGSYGSVYRGYSFQKECLVAIKIVNSHNTDNN